ncbi:MAG: hypothetical protein ACAH22_00060 [Tardiphaga sp.]
MTDRAIEFVEATAARLHFITAAKQQFVQARDGIEPLKSVAMGLRALLYASCLDAAPIDEVARDDIAAALASVVSKVLEEVADDLSHERVRTALSAVIHAFWLECGTSREVEPVRPDQVSMLADAAWWVCGALEELHHRRRLSGQSVRLLQVDAAYHAFDHALPGEHMH